MSHDVLCYRLEHLRLVVVFNWSLGLTLAARTSRASVIATWTSVVAAWSAVVATVVVTAWATVASWLALRLDVSLRLLDESLA